jgi:hypothetical protein
MFYEIDFDMLEKVAPVPGKREMAFEKGKLSKPKKKC